MIFYFSGTGNSRYTAEMMADHLGESLVDVGTFIKQRKTGRFVSERPWIFVAPTYAWRLPRIFVKFLRKSVFEGSRDVYFVMTCGGEIGNANEEIERLCELKQWNYRGVLEVKMPDNYLVMFPVPEEEECREMMKTARTVIFQGIQSIKAGEDLGCPKIGFADRQKSGIVNRIFYRYFIKAKPFYATDQCIHCGKCAKGCMLNNITLEKGRPVWGEHCTHCMACICGCPTEAIEYGKKTQGKRRYHCQVYKRNGNNE